MKSFRFKLQSVLELRKRAEAEAQQVHAEAGRKLEAALDAVAEAEGECRALIDEMGAMQRNAFKPAEREILWNGLKAKQLLAEKLKKAAQQAAKELEEKRAILLHAQSEHAAMVRLREKAQQAHLRDIELHERAAVDEIVNARHAAKRRMGALEASL